MVLEIVDRAFYERFARAAARSASHGCDKRRWVLSEQLRRVLLLGCRCGLAAAEIVFGSNSANWSELVAAAEIWTL